MLEEPAGAGDGRRRELRRSAGVAALALFTLAVGLVGGAFSDQAFPEYVPALVPGQSRAAIDQARFDQAARIVAAHFDPGQNAKLDGGNQTRGSIRGLVQSLGDPYTSYEDPKQYRQQQDNFAGRHTGVVGIYLLFPGGFPVISGVVPGGPAQKAGILPGDQILSVGGKDARGLQAQDTQSLIDGAVGTTVTLVISRGGQALTFTLPRAQFTSPMVLSQMLESQVLYIRVYQFGGSTTQEFDSQLKANLPGAKAIILDLRGNPGGYIAGATAMISRFVTTGEAYELRSRNGGVQRENVEGDHPVPSLGLVVLVDGGTASAAEIVAGSLQSRHRAQLVGVKTFGKGSVQLDFPLGDGSDLHLTVQHWYLPNGQSVDRGVGLQPDATVGLPQAQDMYDAAAPAAGHAADTQLNAALALLSQH